MRSSKDLLAGYLNRQHVMQLATLSRGKPWICSVYYVADGELNLYWASWPSRRHSKEIAKCPYVSAAIAVEGRKRQNVIGIQAEGVAEIVSDPKKIRPIAESYAKAFGRDKQWVGEFSSLKTKHRLYKFTPEKYVLFDEQNFPGDPRKEFSING